MKKRVAIVTWIKYHNFGTFLQAYALQTVIERMGYDVAILDDKNVVEEGRKAVAPMSFWQKSRYLIANTLYRLKYHHFLSLCHESDRLYETFRFQYLTVDPEVHPLNQLDSKYDQFVCGSDQIWAPSPMIFSPYYYLAFTDKKKIAYAPSVGFSKYPESFKSKVKPLLERFSHLSVREQLGADMISNLLQRTVLAVLDPTLLLTTDDWISFISSSSPVYSSKYIFCYFLSRNDDYFAYIRQFAHEKQLPILEFAVEDRYWRLGNNKIAGGPMEFLKAIHDAAYVFTDSFHGTIFSIHFQKRFFTLKRFSETDIQNQNSRINNLLGKLGIDQYFIGREGLKDINFMDQIDYVSVAGRLEMERVNSLDYLRYALKD